MKSRTILENDDLKYFVYDALMDDKDENLYAKLSADSVMFVHNAIKNLYEKIQSNNELKNNQSVIENYHILENEFLQIENDLFSEITQFGTNENKIVFYKKTARKIYNQMLDIIEKIKEIERVEKFEKIEKIRNN